MTYSNRALEIWVGLELAEDSQHMPNQPRGFLRESLGECALNLNQGRENSIPPGTKPIHCRKKILRNEFLRKYMWGLYSHSHKYMEVFKIFEELIIFLKYVFAILQICIHTLPLYGYSGCIHTPLMPVHKNMFGELNSERIHVAHVFAPGRIQGYIPGELIMYWFCAKGLT